MAFLWSWLMDAPGYEEHSPLFPNPLVCARDMGRTLSYEVVERLPWNGVDVWLKETWDDLYSAWFVDWGLVMGAIGCAVVLTLIRIICNFALFRRIPKWVDMAEENAHKFPESMWKFVYYTITWSWAAYQLSNVDYFNDPKIHWRGWYPGQPSDTHLRLLYTLQIGFYLHCTYATVYLETVRRDFLVMILHHWLTIGLLFYSITIRYENVGLVVIFLHDFGDIFLELSKLAHYFEERGGKMHAAPHYLAAAFFLIFSFQHVLFRLYWFPTKVIYSVAHVMVLVRPRAAHYLSLNLMVLSLLAMQIYWFKFIVHLLVKVLVYHEPGGDVRDYDEKEEAAKKKKKN